MKLHPLEIESRLERVCLPFTWQRPILPLNYGCSLSLHVTLTIVIIIIVIQYLNPEILYFKSVHFEAKLFTYFFPNSIFPVSIPFLTTFSSSIIIFVIYISFSLRQYQYLDFTTSS